MEEKEIRREEFTLKGEEVVAFLKKIVHEGNIRRIIINNEEKKSLIEIPLSPGVIGAFLLPVWAAIGAIAALAAKLTIVIEKVEEKPPAG